MAVGPIDYSIGAPDPFQGVMTGLQSGIKMKTFQDERDAAERKKFDADQRKWSMNKDLEALMGKESISARDYADITMKYPEMNESFKQSWEMLQPEQQAVKTSQVSDVYAALSNGNPKAAIDILTKQASAADNSGDKAAAQAAQTMAKLIETSPDVAKSAVGLRLSSMVGPEKMADLYKTLGEEKRSEEVQGSKVIEAGAVADKAVADAETADIQAGFEKMKNFADLTQKQWEVKAKQQEIQASKAKTRIDLLNAQAAKAGDADRARKLKLEADKLQDEMDEKKRTRLSDATNEWQTIDNTINTIDRVLQVPRSVMDSAMGPIAQSMKTRTKETADFEKMVESLTSQAFLAQADKIKGALSDTEGERLSTALQSFSLDQTPDQFVTNLNEARRLMFGSRKNVAVKYNLPEPPPPTQFVETSAEQLNADYEALEREFVDIVKEMEANNGSNP